MILGNQLFWKLVSKGEGSSIYTACSVWSKPQGNQIVAALSLMEAPQFIHEEGKKKLEKHSFASPNKLMEPDSEHW